LGIPKKEKRKNGGANKPENHFSPPQIWGAVKRGGGFRGCKNQVGCKKPVSKQRQQGKPKGGVETDLGNNGPTLKQNPRSKCLTKVQKTKGGGGGGKKGGKKGSKKKKKKFGGTPIKIPYCPLNGKKEPKGQSGWEIRG